MAETYWDIFIKSGSIQDYLSYCAHRPEFQNSTAKDDADAPENKGSDSQGTEYR